MKKNESNYIVGGILILLGIVMAGKALDLWYFTIFFDGWWTLFLIIPGIVGLIRNKGERSFYISLTAIGVLLLLWRQDIISFGMMFPLGLAAVLVAVGIKMIFPQKFKESKDSGSDTTYNYSTADNQGGNDTSSTQCPRHDGEVVCTAVLSGRELRFDNEVFEGAVLSSVLGGIELDLRNAILRENVVIEARAILGGIDIYVPAYAKVVVNDTPILGGVDNKTTRCSQDTEKTVTIQLNATCVLGGIDVK